MAVKRRRPLLSVIVPAYNEAGTFPTLIKALLKKRLRGADKEVIVVESGSSDGTHEQALALKGRRGVRVLLQDRPRGKGFAVRAGLKAARGDIILIQDADLEYDLDDYDKLLAPILAGQRELVLGSRHAGHWRIRQFTGQPHITLATNSAHLAFTFLLNLVCGSKLRDPFTMFKVFRRSCLQGLEFKADRFDFDFELIIKLLRKGYRPLEIPVSYRSRGFGEGKKVRFFRDPLTWVWALIRFGLAPL